jgi:hypothetical protein
MTDMQTSLPLLIVRSSILNPVINFSTHLWLVKWNFYWIYLCLAHSIPSSLISINTITNNMIHFISSCDVLVHQSLLHLLFTVALVHRRQVITQASRYTAQRLASDLPFTLATGLSSQVLSCSSPSSHMTPCHVSNAMSSFITYLLVD